MVVQLPHHTTMIMQSIHQLNPHHPFKPISRTNNHKYKSNNWLKQHKNPMRRKPYQREKRVFLDEFGNI